jgi:hypothetical protein
MLLQLVRGLEIFVVHLVHPAISVNPYVFIPTPYAVDHNAFNAHRDQTCDILCS